MFSRSQSKKQSAENDLIAANRLLAQLKRELNFNINQLEVMQANAKQAHERADLVQEVSDKHAKDLLDTRTKAEEQTKTIEQLANAVLKREKELGENKRALILQGEELNAVEKQAKEIEGRLEEKEKEMATMKEKIREEMEATFKQELEEMKRNAEEELNREREKHLHQVETLQKAWSPQKEEYDRKKREREEKERKREEEGKKREEEETKREAELVETRKEIERLKEELEKKSSEEKPVIIETVIQSPPPPPPPPQDDSSKEELEKLRRTCKEQSDTIGRLEREVESLDDVINEQIAMLEENLRVDEEAGNRNDTEESKEENSKAEQEQRQRAQEEARIHEETRAVLEAAVAEKSKLLDMRDKEIFTLKRSIENLKRSAEVKQRNFEDKLSEEKSKHELELMTLQTRLEASSASAKQYAEAEAEAKRRVEVLERQNSKRIIEEATLRETNAKNASLQKPQQEHNLLAKRDASMVTNAKVPTAPTVPKETKDDRDDGEDEDEEEPIDEKTEIASSSQSSSPPFRDAKKDVANLRKKVAEARKSARSAANSPSSPNTQSPNAQKKSEISALGERSIVKRAIEAQKRVEEAAKGLNRINESQKRLFH
jgi:hypothetical protein